MIITHDIIFIHVTVKNWLNTQTEFKYSPRFVEFFLNHFPNKLFNAPGHVSSVYR